MTAVKVVVRTRPLPEGESAQIKTAWGSAGDGASKRLLQVDSQRKSIRRIQTTAPSNSASCRSSPNDQLLDSTEYAFDAVSDGRIDSQASFFGDHCKPLIVRAIEEKLNVTLFAYGQTGAGKTHTIVGNTHNPARHQKGKQGKKKNSPPVAEREMESSCSSLDGYDEEDVAPQSVGTFGNSEEFDGANGGEDAGASHQEELHEGIIPRTIREVFAEKGRLEKGEQRSSSSSSLSISVSCLELYNEKIFDLLNGSSSTTGSGTPHSPSSSPATATTTKAPLGESYRRWRPSPSLRLRCRRSPFAPEGLEWYVENLFRCECDTAQEAKDHLHAALRRRKVQNHSLNQSSSRSHLLFSLHLRWEGGQAQSDVSPMVDGSMAEVIEHDIVLVDLAGSEKLKQITQGQAMEDVSISRLIQESITINQSLLALGKVIDALAERSSAGPGGKRKASYQSQPQQVHIPYRDSKLTTLLRPALGGNALALMIACIRTDYIDDSVNTMLYAGRARRISNLPTRTEDPRAALIRSLKAQVQQLTSELSRAREALRVRQPHQEAGNTLVASSSADSPSVDEATHRVSVEVVGQLTQKLVASCQQMALVLQTNDRLRRAFDSLQAEQHSLQQERQRILNENEQLQQRLRALEELVLDPAESESNDTSGVCDGGTGEFGDGDIDATDEDADTHQEDIQCVEPSPIDKLLQRINCIQQRPLVMEGSAVAVERKKNGLEALYLDGAPTAAATPRAVSKVCPAPPPSSARDRRERRVAPAVLQRRRLNAELEAKLDKLKQRTAAAGEGERGGDTTSRGGIATPRRPRSEGGRRTARL